MQVQGVEAKQPVEQAGSNAKPAQPGETAFAALLQAAVGRDGTLMRFSPKIGLDPTSIELTPLRPREVDRSTAATPPERTEEPRNAATRPERTQDSEATATTETPRGARDAVEPAPGAMASAASGIGAGRAPAMQDGAGRAGDTASVAKSMAAEAPVRPPATVATPKPTGADASPRPLAAEIVGAAGALHSRPNASLSSGAAAAAQSGTGATGAVMPAATHAASEGGNPLLQSAVGRSAGGAPNAASAGHQQGSAGGFAEGGQGNQPHAVPTPPANAPQASQQPLQPSVLPAGTGSGAAPARAAGGDALPLDSFGNAQTASLSARAGNTAPTAPTRPAAPPHAAGEQIAVQIKKAVAEGVDRIRIQLKPAELGRVEVRLDVAQDGRVLVAISADRPETLELLQRDAKNLQQALEDAGLRSDSGSLTFNLGSRHGGDDPAQPDGSGGSASNASEPEAADMADGRPRRSGDNLIDLEV